MAEIPSKNIITYRGIDYIGVLDENGNVVGNGLTSAPLQNAAPAAGNGTPMTVAGLATVAFTLSGTFVATVVFEGTTVAANPLPGDWFPINTHQSGTTIVSTTATAPGIYRASVAGLTSVRARISAWTSGTVTATGTAVVVEDTSKVTAASIMGRTPISATDIVSATFEKDANGLGALRVIQAALYAYDAINDANKTNIVRRESATIQTHNAVNVALGASVSVASTLQTSSGYGDVAVGIKSDAVHNRMVTIDWFADSGGVTFLGQDVIVVTGSNQYGVGRVTTKAPYFKTTVVNQDGAAAHTMSSWTTLIP